jgi:hypothetical protein
LEWYSSSKAFFKKRILNNLGKKSVVDETSL